MYRTEDWFECRTGGCSDAECCGAPSSGTCWDAGFRDSSAAAVNGTVLCPAGQMARGQADGHTCSGDACFASDCCFAQATWEQCHDCRYCFDCGSYGICGLPVEQICWGQGEYPQCSVLWDACSWYDYANPPSMPMDLRTNPNSNPIPNPKPKPKPNPNPNPNQDIEGAIALCRKAVEVDLVRVRVRARVRSLGLEA